MILDVGNSSKLDELEEADVVVDRMAVNFAYAGDSVDYSEESVTSQ